MHVTIDASTDRAVYLQIMDQVKRDIALGRLVANDKLPTVRQLAAQVLINPNTIAKAYRQLEQEGILRTRPGAGAFVADGDSQLSQEVRRRLVTEQLERTIVDAIHMDIDKETLGAWFEQAVEKFNFGGRSGGEAVGKGGKGGKAARGGEQGGDDE